MVYCMLSVMNEQLSMQSFEIIFAHNISMKGDSEISIGKNSKQKNYIKGVLKNEND